MGNQKYMGIESGKYREELAKQIKEAPKDNRRGILDKAERVNEYWRTRDDSWRVRNKKIEERNEHELESDPEKLSEYIQKVWTLFLNGKWHDFYNASEHFEEKADLYCRILFENARSSKGVERWKYAKNLQRFLEMMVEIRPSQYQTIKEKILSSIPTNEFAVEHLIDLAKEEAPSVSFRDLYANHLERIAEKLKSEFKKAKG